MRHSEDWLGIVLGNLVRVTGSSFRVLGRVAPNSRRVDAFDLKTYFSLDHDLDQILSSLPKDPFLTSAVKEYYGLRILRQDPWECLISFLCSINCNIPSIKLKIENLCQRFGTRIDSGLLDGEYYSFPEPDALAGAEKRELIACKLGFRWKYVRHVSRKVASGELKLDSLSELAYHDSLWRANQRSIWQDIRSRSQSRRLRLSLLTRHARSISNRRLDDPLPDVAVS